MLFKRLFTKTGEPTFIGLSIDNYDLSLRCILFGIENKHRSHVNMKNILLLMYRYFFPLNWTENLRNILLLRITGKRWRRVRILGQENKIIMFFYAFELMFRHPLGVNLSPDSPNFLLHVFHNEIAHSFFVFYLSFNF